MRLNIFKRKTGPTVGQCLDDIEAVKQVRTTLSLLRGEELDELPQFTQADVLLCAAIVELAARIEALEERK